MKNTGFWLLSYLKFFNWINVVDVPLRYGNLPYIYFWRSDSVFSQWYKSEFEVDGIKYICAEQYMMHQKAGMY